MERLNSGVAGGADVDEDDVDMSYSSGKSEDGEEVSEGSKDAEDDDSEDFFSD